MRLNIQELANRDQWEKAGIRLPEFDIKAMIAKTKKNPQWVHFGPGNIFRAFPAAKQQTLLEEGEADTGIIVAETHDYEVIDKLFLPHDNLTLSVTLKVDGSTDTAIIASVAEALKADSGDKDFDRLEEIFRSPSLQMVSFTITEKGYNLTAASGALVYGVEEDFRSGPAAPVSSMGKVAALLYQRYLAGQLPVTLVSMDNCSHNGDRLRDAVLAFARSWRENGHTEAGFEAYIENPAKVGFPWSMIDKIVPRPDDSVSAILADKGVQGMEGQVTAKGTYSAPFVNSEELEYLAIQDVFPNGRPPLEKTGVIFTDRETVDRVEKMKVCICLNPLHTCLAIFGCLLGYTRISDEMKNPCLKKLVEIVGYREGLPVVVDPGIVSPREFIDNVITVRLPNPFMPDTPQRIATDTSQKIPVRFGETIKAYMASETLNVDDLKLIPLVLAAWLRYLMGIDDEGKPFEISPDPLLPSLKAALSGVKLGDKGPFRSVLQPILSNKGIFAVDLYEAGLGERVERCFEELVHGPGAVAETLKRYVWGDSAEH
ncbi:MAG: mannitol dehydrogenase family protein [Treponema sp.]|nr:mannitol dehydrogenase family protein [Treponema sp.]